MNPSIYELLIIGALNTVIQFLPIFIHNPNSAASQRLRHYVDVAITELQQFRGTIPPPSGVTFTETVGSATGTGAPFFTGAANPPSSQP